MATYSVRGRTAATAATADHSIANFWNGDSTKEIVVYECGLYSTDEAAAMPRIYVARTSTQGTAGSTETPDGDCSWAGDGETPPSGATLGLAAFTVQPTKGSPAMQATNLTNATGVDGAGHVWLFGQGIRLRAGTGLSINQAVAQIQPICEVYFVWEEL